MAPLSLARFDTKKPSGDQIKVAQLKEFGIEIHEKAKKYPESEIKWTFW